MAGTLRTLLIGFIAGFLAAAIIFGIVSVSVYSRNRSRELIEYAQKQIEIEALREDFNNRDAGELFMFPGVRGAADSSFADFERKRDEVLQRFRNRLVD